MNKHLLYSGILLFVASVSFAQQTEVYSQDFDGDPGWESTRPDLVYWDANTGLYHTRVQDDGTQYYGISPAFPEVADVSFEIEFDVNPVQVGWGTYPNLIFKHESEGLHRTREDRTNERLWDLRFEVHWDDYYYKKFMLILFINGQYQFLPHSPTFTENTWYHQRFTYDLDSETLTWTITHASNGNVFHQASLEGIQFDPFNQVVAGHQGVQPHYGYGRWCTTLFDNLRVRKSETCELVPGTSECNLPPVAVDKVKTVVQNTSRFVNVAVLDSDPNNNLYYGSVVLLTNPEHGTLQDLGYGAYTYTPDPDYLGSDFIEYRICDFLGLCDEGRVTLNVIEE